MAKRSPRQQSKHDQAIKDSAGYYQGLGYKVEADIPGYPTPIVINGRRPDLIAKNGKKSVILEVETKDTLDQDKDQQQVFKNYADKHKDTRFRIKVV